MSEPVWRKAKASAANGNCVEVYMSGATVLVRDSKDPLGSHLHFSKAEWDAFLDGVRHGEFDRP